MSKVRRSLLTPKNRKSMGFTSAAAKLRGETPLERKKLTFGSASARKTGASGGANLSVMQSGSRRTGRWSTGLGKDTRPLTSKAYQRLMVEEIIEFLNEWGYPHLITAKILSSPTTKEFIRVFEHLYNFIVPNFSLEQKKYAEEIPMLMKYLHFPFQISKSTMFGIGSMHAWPALLGVLHWLVELIQTTNSIDIEQVIFPTALQEDSNCIHKKLFYEHSARTYVQFMCGQEDFSEENEALRYAAMHLTGCSSEGNDSLELEALIEELDELENEPDILVEAMEHKTALEDSIRQSEEIINELERQNSFQQTQHYQFSSEVKDEGIIVQHGDSTRQEELKRKSSEIELELSRLNTEKERLEQHNDDREVRYSRLYNKFAAAATEYNDIARKLNPNPHIQKYVGEESIMLQFAHSQDTLNDFKHHLKPLLVKLSHQIGDDRFKLEARKIEMEEELDKMKEELLNKKDIELVRLKDQLSRIEKELEVNMESVEKEYTTSLEGLKQKEYLLDKKQKEVTELLEEDKLQLATKKKECDVFCEKRLQEQNIALDHLLMFGQKVVEHKKCVEDQIDMFNNYLSSEIKNIIEEEDNISLLLSSA